MDVLTSIVGAALAETGRFFCGSLYSNIRPVFRFQKNVNDLEKEIKKLMDLSHDVKHLLESAERNGRSATVEVKKWLRDVEQLFTKVNGVQGTANGRRFCVCPWYCARRIRLGKGVEKMLKEAETLLKASFPGGTLSVNNSAKPVEFIPGPSIEHQITASRTLAELMKHLDDGDIRRIGLWGIMGGVGKTTLAKNLNNKFSRTSSSKPFSIVIWATVSKDLDMKRIQRQIAERLNLEVPMEIALKERAVGFIKGLRRKSFFSF